MKTSGTSLSGSLTKKRGAEDNTKRNFHNVGHSNIDRMGTSTYPAVMASIKSYFFINARRLRGNLLIMWGQFVMNYLLAEIGPIGQLT